MSTQLVPAAPPSAEPRELFTRIVVGVDASPESIEAARQAALLAEPSSVVKLVGAWTVPAPVIGVVGSAYTRPDDQAELQQEHARLAVAAAQAEVVDLAQTVTKTVRGLPRYALLAEVASAAATLAVVGSHGNGRLQGIVMGSIATEVVHNAPCAVLVARAWGNPVFARRIVVGVDGSPESAVAFTVAADIAARFGAELWPVVAHAGRTVDKRAVDAIVGHRREDIAGDPARALVAAAADADLVVVGSRGLHGLRALGSVSERVAHEAPASTLIVR